MREGEGGGEGTKGTECKWTFNQDGSVCATPDVMQWCHQNHARVAHACGNPYLAVPTEATLFPFYHQVHKLHRGHTKQ